MQALHNLNTVAALNTLVSLFFAFVFGSVIGLERQIRQRTAGLRTNTLVAVGAAVFVDLALRLNGTEGATRVIAYVVSGVGFLGAGSIMKEGANVTGLNTAATLWGSAAVGACCGSSMIVEGGMATVFVLASNTLLRPVVNTINRRPVDEEAGEAMYYVYAICNSGVQAAVREKMLSLLEAANYPARSVEKHPFGPQDTEIEIVLHATSVDAAELDQVVQQIGQLPGVMQAFWNPSTSE
ncbi:MgtC/SapB family protein [Diaphorobacter aerolatus]|uniref:Protein MgtC n=1 Tax=Diaphorobacter aerolatus TaxID=1288495 RepID=A0A7H0GP15_9BURK|nr:MgtC/SapB family protein [Diaphorobacter aerolatus]QNP50031.1 MgtC/SapB family protein [Diaphorobacter aerolatus]